MTPAAATIIGAVVGGLVAILVALINSWFGRAGRRADFTEKITKASETLMDRMAEEHASMEAKFRAENEKTTARCDKCEAELKKVYRALRELLLADERGDKTAKATAKANAWTLING